MRQDTDLFTLFDGDVFAAVVVSTTWTNSMCGF